MRSNCFRQKRARKKKEWPDDSSKKKQSNVALNPSVGLTNLMVKAGPGKEAGAVYAVIESVGTSGVNPVCEGKEFKLEHVQEMMLRM